MGGPSDNHRKQQPQVLSTRKVKSLEHLASGIFAACLTPAVHVVDYKE